MGTSTLAVSTTDVLGHRDIVTEILMAEGQAGATGDLWAVVE